MSLDRDISQSIILFCKDTKTQRGILSGPWKFHNVKALIQAFHLNNGCSNLNDLTGTSSLLIEAGYYKESVIHIWAELRQLYQVQKHPILSIQVYSPESAVEATM